MILLLPVALAFIVGILLEGVVNEPWLGVVFIAVASVLIFLRRSYPALMMLCVVAGYLHSSFHSPRPLPDSLCNDVMEMSGVVREHREYEGARMLILAMDSCDEKPCPVTLVKCLVPSLLPEIGETCRLKFKGELTPLADNIDLPDEINPNATLRRLGVTGEAIIPSDSISYIGLEPGLRNDIRRMRDDVQRIIALSPLEENTRVFLIAVLTGDRTFLHPDTHKLFSVTGVAHVLALSGLHVGVLTMLLMILLHPISFQPEGRYIRMIIIVAVLWGFAIMTGLSASVVRAVLMATFFALTTMLQRVWSPVNALSASALIILLFSPSQIYTLGFALTFLAVLSILVFAERLNPIGYHRPLLRSLVAYICVTVSAVLATGILCAWQFHIFPVYFLFTNIAVSLLMPMLLGGGVVLLIFNALGFKAVWLAIAVDWIIRMVEGVVSVTSRLPGAYVSDLWVSEGMVLMYFIALILFGVWLYRRRRVYVLSIMAVTVSALTITAFGGESFPKAEMFITRSASETSMIVHDRGRMYMFTTAPEGRRADLIGSATRRYHDYMLRRKISDLSPLFDETDTGILARKGRTMTVGNRKFTFVSHSRHVAAGDGKLDYAVVCRGFRGDICRLATAMRADTILLSRDLNLRRHDRYVRELSEANIPYRSLRDKPFHLIL